MKRILWLGLLVAAILVIGATYALAQESTPAVVAPVEAAPATGLPAPVVKPGFVDANGDGACDNCGQGNGAMVNFVDANGDGVCDNCAAGGGQAPRGPRAGNSGANFVDADGDGLCDNCGGGMQGHNGARNGGGNFVDADGDGVCDNCGQGMGNGAMANFVDADGDGVCDNLGQNMGRGAGRGQGQGKGFRGGRGG